jgi:hypothetical protein
MGMGDFNLKQEKNEPRNAVRQEIWKEAQRDARKSTGRQELRPAVKILLIC